LIVKRPSPRTATLQGVCLAERLHLRYGCCQAGDQGAGDDGVADVEFFEVGDGEEFADTAVIEAMASVDPQTEVMSKVRARGDLAFA
jgi:hypothetical protein